MKKISTVQVIDTLAEITRHHDRQLLERSLTSTLAELIPSQEFRLYRVVLNGSRIEIALLTLVRQGLVVTESDPAQTLLSAQMSGAITEAVQSAGIVHLEDPRTADQHLIYPVFDKENEIYGVLVQTAERPSLEDQRFTHGLLRVYSNYLMLLEESQHDKLTQLLNRETLDREVTKVIIANNKKQYRMEKSNTAKRLSDEETYWLCVADLDHFKRINDKFGHLYGDEVLILFARLLESVFRDEDQLFRYGGEEFIALFRTRSREDARAVCERFRKTVEEHEFPRVGQVTVSIGVVEIGRQEGTTGVIDQADQALYYSKEHGRNQVNFYLELLADGLLEETATEQDNAVDFF
jgi:two-component system cell cycle response regulator